MKRTKASSTDSVCSVCNGRFKTWELFMRHRPKCYEKFCETEAWEDYMFGGGASANSRVVDGLLREEAEDGDRYLSECLNAPIDEETGELASDYLESLREGREIDDDEIAYGSMDRQDDDAVGYGPRLSDEGE